MEDRGDVSHRQGAGPWLLVGALVVVPTAALVGVALFVSETPSELSNPPAPVVVAATERTIDGHANATLNVTVGSMPALLSTGAAGLVTDVMVSKGDSLPNGAPVYAVNNATIRLMLAPSPLYRPLDAGLQGQDVKHLEEYLQDLDLFEGEPNTSFDDATAAAVSSYQGEVGMLPTGVFEPSMVVWAREPMLVAEVSISPGQPAPGLGETVMLAPPEIVSATLTNLALGVTNEPEPIEISIQGEVIGTVATPPQAPLDLARDLLIASGVDLSAIPEEGVSVTTRLTHPRSVLSVPASAVMVDDEGTSTCVWTTSAPAEGYVPVPVEITGGDFGSSDISAELADREVLANPQAVLSDPGCP